MYLRISTLCTSGYQHYVEYKFYAITLEECNRFIPINRIYSRYKRFDCDISRQHWVRVILYSCSELITITATPNNTHITYKPNYNDRCTPNIIFRIIKIFVAPITVKCLQHLTIVKGMF